MQTQIASYLFQTKTCPLPGLGTLSVLSSGADADFTNKLIAAPKPFIQFTNTESETSGLVTYLANSNGCHANEAAEALYHFCENIKRDITAEADVNIESVGNFFVDGTGTISFKPEELPVSFAQPVIAERVIHLNAEHQMLVGDKETTNTRMTEFLAPKTAIADRWWIWAIVLAAVGLTLLAIYFTQFENTSSFGNVVNYIHS